MAITIPVVQAALQAARASGGLTLAGPNFDTMSLGIAQAIVQWGVGQPQNLSLTGVTAGSGGTGIINPPTTKIIVPPNVGTLMAALSGAGVSGPVGMSLATVVAMGVSNAFSSSGQYLGVSPTVGVGTDTSRISVSNAAALVGILMGCLDATMGAGSSIGMLSTGLGNGISALLLQGTGIGAVTGIPAPYAAAGVTTSVVV